MIHVSRSTACIALAAFLFIATWADSTSAAVPYSEDWSAGDTNGWQQGTTSTTVLRSAGTGNPAGSIVMRRVLDDEEGIFDLSATSELPAISDDYTGVPAWMVSFDVRYEIGDFTDTRLRFRFQDPTFNGWYKSVANAFPIDTWESYSVMFDPAWTDAQAAADGWVDETGGTISWQQMMGDVYHPEVRLVLGDLQSAVGYLDNFVLKSVPEPTTLALLLAATLALTLNPRRRRAQ